MESFLSPDEVDGRDVFGKLKQSQSELAADLMKGANYVTVLMVTILFSVQNSH